MVVVMEPAATFEEVQIPLPEPIHGRTHLSGVLGIPEWWPTGERIAVVIAHGGTSNYQDPMIAAQCNGLTERGYMTLRFNFPFAEAGKRASSDSPAVLERAYRAALNLLGRDTDALPARLLVGGVGIGGRVAAGLVSDRLQADGFTFNIKVKRVSLVNHIQRLSRHRHDFVTDSVTLKHQ